MRQNYRLVLHDDGSKVNHLSGLRILCPTPKSLPSTSNPAPALAPSTSPPSMTDSLSLVACFGSVLGCGWFGGVVWSLLVGSWVLCRRNPATLPRPRRPSARSSSRGPSSTSRSTRPPRRRRSDFDESRGLRVTSTLPPSPRFSSSSDFEVSTRSPPSLERSCSSSDSSRSTTEFSSGSSSCFGRRWGVGLVGGELRLPLPSSPFLDPLPPPPSESPH